MNSLPALKDVDEHLNEMYMRVIELEKQIQTTLNETKPEDNNAINTFFSNLKAYSLKSRENLSQCIKKIEEEKKSIINGKVKGCIRDPKKIDAIQKSIIQYPLSFYYNSNLIKCAISQEDLPLLKEYILSKYDNVRETIRAKLNLKNSTTIENINQNISTSSDNVNRISSKRIQKTSQIADSSYGKMGSKTSQKISEKQPPINKESEESDFEKLLKRDELRRKLLARKNIPINKSKIDKDLKEARKK